MVMRSGRQQRAVGAPPPEGSSACNLPSGKIGKLLVFKSGRVKLQMGDVLMDVSAGMPIAHRQDVSNASDVESGKNRGTTGRVGR